MLKTRCSAGPAWEAGSSFARLELEVTQAAPQKKMASSGMHMKPMAYFSLPYLACIAPHAGAQRSAGTVHAGWPPMQQHT